MTSLRSLLRRGDTGSLSPLARRAAIGLALVTPLLIAGVAVTALQPPAGTTTTAAAESGVDGTAPAPAAPLLPAAVVNDDAYVMVTGADGQSAPLLIGKLITTGLTDGTSGKGFSWTVTDADTAASGLTSGRYAAVVTIPADFTKSYLSLQTADPVQASLEVQTSGSSGYATEQLASALSTDLQAAVADQATNQYVTTTLSSFATVRKGFGDAAAGATTLQGYIQQSSSGAAALAGGLQKAVDEGSAPLASGLAALSGGLNEIVTKTADLPAGTAALSEAATGVTTGITFLKGRLAEETAASAAIDDRQKALEAGMAALSDEVPTLTPQQIQDRLAALQEEAAGIRVSSFEVTLGLGVDALGVTGLELYSGAVSTQQAALAAGIPALTSGLSDAAIATGKLATGSAALSDGLQKAATSTGELASGLGTIGENTGLLATNLQKGHDGIPDYSADQQTQIATVVTDPIVTRQSTVEAMPSAAAAVAAVAVPLALWLGAFAIYLLLVPFTRRALDSTASTARVVVAALVPAAALALVQAVVVAVVLLAVGADAARVGGSILFSLVMSLVFVALHQGVIALFGQAGRMLSLALLAVQVVAAAVIIPAGLSSPFYTGLASVLPLSTAITGMQALLGGGSPATALQAALTLAVFGLVGLALALVAASRRRSRDVVA